MIFLKDTIYTKSSIVEYCVRLFTQQKITPMQMLLLIISIWFEISLPDDTQLSILTLNSEDSTLNTEPENYLFIAISKKRSRLGYIFFEDENCE